MFPRKAKFGHNLSSVTLSCQDKCDKGTLADPYTDKFDRQRVSFCALQSGMTSKRNKMNELQRNSKKS